IVKLDGRFLRPVIKDSAIPAVTQAYFLRIAEATQKTFRNRHIFPKSYVQLDVQRLKRDVLPLLFLHHLFSFRNVELGDPIAEEETLTATPTSLLITDDELGAFRLNGDGRQMLTFDLLRGDRKESTNLGAALRQPSFDFLSDNHSEHDIEARAGVPS